MIQRVRRPFAVMRVGLLLVTLVAPSAAQVWIDAGETSGYPGWIVELPVAVRVTGTAPSSAGATLFFSDPRSVKIAARSDGKPDCRVTANVGTPAAFVFWPVGCIYEEDECDSLRILAVDVSGT